MLPCGVQAYPTESEQAHQRIHGRTPCHRCGTLCAKSHVLRHTIVYIDTTNFVITYVRKSDNPLSSRPTNRSGRTNAIRHTETKENSVPVGLVTRIMIAFA